MEPLKRENQLTKDIHLLVDNLLWQSNLKRDESEKSYKKQDIVCVGG